MSILEGTKDPRRHAAGAEDVTYDVIVVGAGPGGCAIAANLSADPELSVLLVERGPDWRVADTPMEMYAHGWIAYRGTEAMQCFHSFAGRARKTHAHEPALYLSGQGIGGSSLINGQIALRPPLDEYDVWSELGAERWSSRMALDLWRRVERDGDFGDRPEHGADGPFSIERTPRDQWSDLDRAFFGAAIDSGYPVVEDFNATAVDGVGPLPFSRRNGLRVTANHAYIDAARERPNLTILADTIVDRVRFDGTGVRVTGVTARSDGELRRIRGERVVCAAGTAQSAGILMRSGVGPAAELQVLGLEVHADLPVGKAIQDHLMFSVSADWTVPEMLTMHLERNWASCAVRYSSGMGGAPPGDMILLPTGLLEIAQVPFPPAVSVWNFETFSRGELRLTGTDPLDPLDVCIGIYSDERDLVRMRDGARRAVGLLDNASFDALRGAERRGGIIGAPLADMDNDAAVDAMLRETTEIHAHLSASAPMGREGSEGAVVDDNARVYGINGLWVGDLSICPKVTRAGTHPTAALLGEFVSDRLIEDIHGRRSVAGAA